MKIVRKSVRFLVDNAAIVSLYLTGMVLIAIAIVSFCMSEQNLADQAMVTHSYQVLNGVSRVFSELKDVETGSRGYVLTGRDRYLVPYTDSRARVMVNLAALEQLTHNDPRTEARLNELQPLVQRKLDELENTVRVRRQQGFAAAVAQIDTDRGQGIMEHIRALVSTTAKEEQRILARRHAIAERSARRALLWFVFGPIIGCLLLIAAGTLMLRYLRQRTAAEAANARLVNEAAVSALRQRNFLKDVLLSVTQGRLHLCDTADELPRQFEPFGEAVDLSDPRRLGTLRGLVQEAASACGFTEDRFFDLVTATGEASMNAIVHGVEGTGTVYVSLDGVVQVRIVDHGTGIDVEALPQSTLQRGYSSKGTLGHGFFLILSTIDRVYLLTSHSGTTVVLEQDRTPAQAPWLADALMAP